MWDLSQNDGPTANVLMHIIIYSTVYEKINKKKLICIYIGSVGLYIYFGIRATVKLLKKKRVLQFFPLLHILSHSFQHLHQFCTITMILRAFNLLPMDLS